MTILNKETIRIYDEYFSTLPSYLRKKVYKNACFVIANGLEGRRDGILECDALANQIANDLFFKGHRGNCIRQILYCLEKLV